MLLEEPVEVVMDRLDDLVEAPAKPLETRRVLLPAAGQMRRNLGILNLVFRAGDDPDPGLAMLARIPLDGRNRITLSTQTTSGLSRDSTSGKSFSAHLAVETIACQQSFT